MAVNDKIYKMSKSNAEVALLISMAIDNETKIILIDTVGETSVRASSTLTEHPMPSGEMAADHMFKEPVTLDISGEFPLVHGTAQSLFVDASGAYLANVEETFERIKNEGIVCEIAKITANDNNVRFKRRANMVLTNISWTEKISSLSFTFNFREVQFVDVQEYNIDMTDPYAVDLESPKESKFTDVLFDKNQSLRQIVEILLEDGLLQQELWNTCTSLDDAKMWAISGGVAALAIAIGVLAVVCSTNPVGWVLLAAGALIAATVAQIYFIVKGIKSLINTITIYKNYGVKPFKKYKSDKKTNEEITRLAEYLNKINNEFDVLNNSIKVYSIAKNEQQEVLLTIDDQICTFTFTKNNATDVFNYDCVAKNYSTDETYAARQNICTSAPTSFGECDSSQALATLSNGTSVYIVCPTENRDDLTNFMLIVSSIKPEEFNKVFSEITMSALRSGK